VFIVGLITDDGAVDVLKLPTKVILVFQEGSLPPPIWVVDELLETDTFPLLNNRNVGVEVLKIAVLDGSPDDTGNDSGVLRAEGVFTAKVSIVDRLVFMNEGTDDVSQKEGDEETETGLEWVL
jgi:hypothetical protein